MKVRSATTTMLAIGAAFAAWPASAAAGEESASVAGGPGLGDQPRVSLVVLPREFTVESLATTSPELSLGLLSAGLGAVSGAQTYLDVGQGNRINDSLYPFDLPLLFPQGSGVAEARWDRTLERADDAPAQLLPGLLTERLQLAGVPVRAMPGAAVPALLAVAPDGSIDRAEGCRLGRCPGLTVGEVERRELPGLVAGLRGADLLIALERAPGSRRLLPLGIAGEGFGGGDLRSRTTRIDGYVLSTDLAPTILRRYGLEVPEQMSGEPIEAGPERDVAGLVDRENRLIEISDRRHPVLGVNLMLWVAIVLAGLPFLGSRWARWALPTLAITIVWVPALLLATAALQPDFLGERLIIGIGTPALAILTQLLLARRFGSRAPYAGFALAAIVSVTTTAIDVIAGSPLTSLSLIGSNPALGVRFFGIGNELEAVIGVLLPLGSGAAVAALQPRDPLRAVAVTVSVATVLAVAVFAPGRFGADVGAAVTFPAGAAGVVLAALGGGRRRIALLVAAPVLALLALIGVDLVIGGDAHLSRSVLQAGGLDQLGEVIERRTRLGAASFERFFDSFFFMVALVLITASLVFHRRILSWFAATPAARAGLFGGVAAAIIGTLANDSGALILMLATAYLLAYAGSGWVVHYFTSDSDSR